MRIRTVLYTVFNQEIIPFGYFDNDSQTIVMASQLENAVDAGLNSTIQVVNVLYPTTGVIVPTAAITMEGSLHLLHEVVAMEYRPIDSVISCYVESFANGVASLIGTSDYISNILTHLNANNRFNDGIHLVYNYQNVAGLIPREVIQGIVSGNPVSTSIRVQNTFDEQTGANATPQEIKPVQESVQSQVVETVTEPKTEVEEPVAEEFKPQEENIESVDINSPILESEKVEEPQTEETLSTVETTEVAVEEIKDDPLVQPISEIPSSLEMPSQVETKINVSLEVPKTAIPVEPVKEESSTAQLLTSVTSEGGALFNKNTIEEMFIPRVVYDESFDFPRGVQDDMDIRDKLSEIYTLSKTDDLALFNDKILLEAVTKHFMGDLSEPPRTYWDTLSLDMFLNICKVKILDKSTATNGLYEGMYYTTYLYYQTLRSLVLFNNQSKNNRTMCSLSLNNLISLAIHMTKAKISVDEDEDNEESSLSGEYNISASIYQDEIVVTTRYLKEFLFDNIISLDMKDDNGDTVGVSIDRIKRLCDLGVKNMSFKISHDIFTKMNLKDVEVIIKETDIIFMANKQKLCPYVIGKMYQQYKNNISNYITVNGATAAQSATLTDKCKNIDYNIMLEQIKGHPHFANILVRINEFTPMSNIQNYKLIPTSIVFPNATDPKSVVLQKPIGILFDNINAITSSNAQIFLPIFGEFWGQIEDLGLKISSLQVQKVLDIPLDGESVPVYMFKLNDLRQEVKSIRVKQVFIDSAEDIKLPKLLDMLQKNGNCKECVIPEFALNDRVWEPAAKAAFNLK